LRVRVSTVVDAPPREVWEDVRDLASHVEWMEDAVEIRFVSEAHEGVGTEFVCTTRVGPIRLADRMTVTEWAERKTIGIRHTGLVTGEGRFTLQRARGGRTRFTWTERLRFPWWLGGPVGALAGRPVLRRIWRRNLRHLADRFSDR
jgi:hypothetical protein